MTTIAYRDGVMAADSRAYSGSRFPLGSKAKIRRMEDGTLMGVSSTKPGQAEAIMDWYQRGARLEDRPGFTPDVYFLVVKPDGKAFYASDQYEMSGPITAPFFAVGSGGEYAQGAMAMGATAEQAVEISCRLDPWSEGPILVLAH